MDILLLNPKDEFKADKNIKYIRKRVILLNIIMQEIARGMDINIVYDEIYLGFLPKLLYSLSLEQLEYIKLYRRMDWEGRGFDYIYYPKK